MYTYQDDLIFFLYIEHEFWPLLFTAYSLKNKICVNNMASYGQKQLGGFPDNFSNKLNSVDMRVRYSDSDGSMKLNGFTNVKQENLVVRAMGPKWKMFHPRARVVPTMWDCS